MYYDDLPIWGFIGKVEKVAGSEEHQYSIFTHVHFDISYNKDKVIEINVATDPKALVRPLPSPPPPAAGGLRYATLCFDSPSFVFDMSWSRGKIIEIKVPPPGGDHVHQGGHEA